MSTQTGPSPTMQYRMAMPPSRLLAGGMDDADVTDLWERVEAGDPWDETGSELAMAARGRAQAARLQGHDRTASAWFFRAAAAWRFAAGAAGLTPENLGRLNHEMIADFRAGAELDAGRVIDHVEIPWGPAQISGWLLRPPEVEEPPVVILVGGLGARKEEGEAASRFLTDRGLAVLLADLPGQGETLLRHGAHLQAGGETAVSACVDFLSELDTVGSAVGIWGNSLGGLLATRAAAAEPRLRAVCINGSPIEPSRMLERMPRPLGPQWGEPFGLSDGDAVLECYRALDCTPELIATIGCPAIVVHGGRDALAPLEMARAMFDQLRVADKQFLAWEDGNHCAYNHAFERNCSVSDWFSVRLGGPPGGRSGTDTAMTDRA